MSQVAQGIELVVLNGFGLAMWRHKDDKTKFVVREFDWRDRVLVLEEVDEDRTVVVAQRFSTFNFSNWIPVSVDEFKKIKRFCKDIYD